MREPKRLTVAKILCPHGMRGEVQVSSFTDFPARFKPGTTFVLCPPLLHVRRLTIEGAKSHGDKINLKFKEINDRGEAEKLRGHLLEIPIEEAEPLPKNSYWFHQIIELEVVTTEGRLLGRVVEILRTGANDVYVVKPPGRGKEILIPAIKEVVEEIDLKAGRMVIEVIPGLLD